MKLLALDTATEACSAAVWVNGSVSACFEIAGREHTHRLLPVVTNALQQAGISYSDLDAVVCGLGPGSFAGVRIGVAFAKGVALARDLPMLGVSTLALLAQAALSEPGCLPVLVAIDARLGEVYFQAFERNAQGMAVAVSEPVVCAPHAVIDPGQHGQWQAVGTGWGVYEPVLRARIAGQILTVAPEALPQAASAFALAIPAMEQGLAVTADALQPVYLRNQIALTLIEQHKLRAEAGKTANKPG